jgi:hypothetical protein
MTYDVGNPGILAWDRNKIVSGLNPTFLCISHGILQSACAIKETNKRLDQSENQNDISFWPLGVVILLSHHFKI